VLLIGHRRAYAGFGTLRNAILQALFHKTGVRLPDQLVRMALERSENDL
jgi:hypothetical protein